MGNRDFSDTAKLETIKNNLEKNNGEIRCETCGKKLTSISEGHFDHIFPYAKGGNSSAENCQILCIDCNLKKNDKQLRDFILEEKAKRFLEGENIELDNISYEDTNTKNEVTNDKTETPYNKRKTMTKDEFDIIIKDFIERKGDIHKVDFTREYNGLPSIHYVRTFYGDLSTLKKAFGIEDKSLTWNRETIKEAIDLFVEKHGDLFQKDMKKCNGLPSVPCILNYYPEFKSFTDIKSKLCGLKVKSEWTVERAIEVGKEYLKHKNKITQTDLTSSEGLPSNNTINRLFGSLANYQRIVGSEVTYANEFVSKEDIRKALKSYFKDKKWVVETQQQFFDTFEFSQSTIFKRYGSFIAFCKEEGIQVLKTKKAKYTKREVDDCISAWIKEGNDIPLGKDLTKLGLPSTSVILKYYENWKEPFEIYKKIHDEVNRV